jgi:curved DNA-binding protein CbpA
VLTCDGMAGPTGDSRTYSLSSTPAPGSVSVPRLLFAFLRQRFTGTVTLEQRQPGGTRCVWVRGGMPVFCDWDSKTDRLGELLRAAGVIDEATLDQVLKIQASSKALGSSGAKVAPLGAVLLEQRKLDEAMRTHFLREQCARKLTHLFAADAIRGDAIVTAVEHGKGNGDELGQINVLGLLLAGVDAHYDLARIQTEMGAAFAEELVATPALPRYERQFGFGPRDTPILQAVARGVTYERMQGPGVDPLRAAKIVYTLWVAQMLRLGDDALQAIAKGATAAAAAQELGVSIGARAASEPKPAAKPEPAKPPPPPSPAAAKPTPKPAAKPEPEPEPEPEPDTSAADVEFEERLAALEAKVAARANAFALFGLELTAERAEVRAAWADLSKTFHPDALEGSGRRELRPRVEPVFAALSEAYGVLSDKEQRQKLRDAIAAGGTDLKSDDDATTVVRNAFEAEMIAREADKLLRAKQWTRALELFERAHELSPQDSDIEAALHYTRFKAGPGEQGQALTTISSLETLIQIQPMCARAHYVCALIQLSIEDMQGAKRNFAKAHELDPRNIDAERQLRAIKLRERPAAAAAAAAKEDKKKSAFGLRGLFKKD